MSDFEIVFLDLETTGLDPDRHTITEIGLILPIYPLKLGYWVCLTDEEISVADTCALQVNHYQHRTLNRPGSLGLINHSNRGPAARRIAYLTDKSILAGCNVKFDQVFLEKWLRRHGACPTWDYHVLDVPTYVAGVLNERRRVLLAQHKRGVKAPYDELKPPYTTKHICEALGLEMPEEAHTALGDARLAKQMWEAVQ